MALPIRVWQVLQRAVHDRRSRDGQHVHPPYERCNLEVLGQVLVNPWGKVQPPKSEVLHGYGVWHGSSY